MMDKTKEKNEFEDDFIYVVRSHEVLEQIIYSAQETNDIMKFGLTVANILLKNKLIDEAIFEILAAGEEPDDDSY
jgi:hypothetical protein